MNRYTQMINLICSALQRLPETVDCDQMTFQLELTEMGVWLKVTDPVSGAVFGRKGRSLEEAWGSIRAYADHVLEEHERRGETSAAGSLVDLGELERMDSARFRLAREVEWCGTTALWHLQRLDALVVDREDDLSVARDLTPLLLPSAADADRTE